jgi:hypothetical protein
MQMQFNDLYTANADAMKRMAKLNSRVWDRIRDEQFNLLRVCTECGQRQIGIWGNGNGAQRPDDFVAAETDILKQLSRQMVEYSRIVVANAHDAVSEAMNCVEELFESFDQSQDGNGEETEAKIVTHEKRSVAPSRSPSLGRTHGGPRVARSQFVGADRP